MRGTPKLPVRGKFPPRFIPAYAGNTIQPTVQLSLQAVHPRVCGEHIACQPRNRHIDGSSPRMRGTRGNSETRITSERFIPAYAGNTSGSLRMAKLNAVHPRVCGEHDIRYELPSS